MTRLRPRNLTSSTNSTKNVTDPYHPHEFFAFHQTVTYERVADGKVYVEPLMRCETRSLDPSPSWTHEKDCRHWPVQTPAPAQAPAQAPEDLLQLDDKSAQVQPQAEVAQAQAQAQAQPQQQAQTQVQMVPVSWWLAANRADYVQSDWEIATLTTRDLPEDSGRFTCRDPNGSEFTIRANVADIYRYRNGRSTRYLNYHEGRVDDVALYDNFVRFGY